MSTLTPETMSRLAAQFPESALSFKPGRVSEQSGKAIVLTYIDHGAVVDRLNEVVPGDWSSELDVIYCGEPTTNNGRTRQHVVIRCRLTICGVTRDDVGEAGPEDEPFKSAASDALKRAASRFGVGAYVRDADTLWWPYNSQYRRFENSEGIAKAILAAFGGTVVEDEQQPAKPTSQPKPQAGPGEITMKQRNLLKQLAITKWGNTPAGVTAYREWLGEEFGATTSSDLSKSQASQAIDMLTAMTATEEAA